MHVLADQQQGECGDAGRDPVLAPPGRELGFGIEGDRGIGMYGAFVWAAIALAGNIKALAVRGRVHAVFSIYADKPVHDVATALAQLVDVWHLYQMKGRRALDIEGLESVLRVAHHAAKIMIHGSLREALRIVDDCEPLDTVVIFGSFEVAGEALEILDA